MISKNSIRIQISILLSIIWIVMSHPMKNDNPFSYKELLQIPAFTLKQPSFLHTSDGIDLAYYAFLPQKPSAIIVFYHGGGFYTNSAYQYIGMRLEKEYNIGSYFIDIRGHGHSQGPRGDAPSIEQVFEDISTVLIFVKKTHPSTPIYLAGHSSGAGLILNYTVYPKKIDVNGYILLAPYLGPRVGVERSGAPAFVKKVRLWIYLLNQLLKIPFFQHTPAVFFNYPDALLKQDPLIVTSYTYTMSCGTTPNNPQGIFEQLDKPTTLYIGSDDEQFDPEKVTAFAQYNKNGLVSAQIVPNLKHLTILLDAPELIAQAIKQ